jgi:hypothetical protein
MALKQNYAVKCVLGNTDLELSADPGEAFLIKDIQIYNPAINYVTFRSEKTTVGYFRVGGPLGSHLPFLNGRSGPQIDAHTAAAVADHAALVHAVTQPADHPAHSHKAGTHVGSAAGADQTLFVDLIDGAGTTIGANVLGKSGATTDTDIITDTLAAQAHSGAAVADHAALVHTVTQAARHTIASVPMLGMKTLLGDLVGRALLGGYPVAEGETFRITGAKQDGAIQLVFYEVYEPGDIKPDDPNGSRSKEYLFVQYGNSGGNINVDGETHIDICQTPPEFPDFPFGKVVPAKHEIELINILASDFAPVENTAVDYTYTQYLKMVFNREVLFDDDRNGLLLLGPTGVNVGGRDRVAEGQSIIGNYSNVDMRLPLIFPAPLSFTPGDELLVYLTTGKLGAGQNIDIYEQEIAMVQSVKRGE